MVIDTALAYLAKNKDRFLEDLKVILNIPSISGLDSHKGDVLHCALCLVDELKTSGLTHARILNPDQGVPIVYGEWLGAPGQPTLLVYGHYDVVGVEDESGWRTKPFGAVVRDGCIWGRGTTDDKGQFFTSVKAVQSIVQAEKRLPVNVKFILEGEEETSSETLEKALGRPENLKQLACDAIVISDGSWYLPGMPTMCAGVRGICEFELNIKGPLQPLHSGVYGGAVANPVSILLQMLGKLWDKNGRILLPGFYDNVVPVSDKDRTELERLPFDEGEYKKQAGVKNLYGEIGYTPLERTWCRPAMDVVGVWGGYMGEGPKSAIPTSAGAKVSIRLVADQNAKEIERMVEHYFREICPPGIELSIKFFCGGDPYLTRVDDPMLTPARNAIRETFGREPCMVRTGGSIPIMPVLHRNLKAPVVMCDLGLPTDNEHSDNEHYPLEQFFKGIEMYIRLFYAYAKGH